MRHSTTILFAATALLALPVSRASSGELALEGHAGYFDLAASNTATAVYGSAGTGTFGGALRYTAWRSFFVSAGVHTLTKDGERVFVAAANAPVQRLGFPLTMRTTSMLFAVGYRLRDGHLIVPYLQAGLAATRYKVTSEVAGEVFDEDQSKTGFTGAVGFELGRGLLRVGGEFGYTSAPNVLGAGGVSGVYGEKDAGGLYVVGKLGIAFRIF